MKIIISAGGTGGHLYPALSLAEIIRERDRNISVFFITKKKNYNLIKEKGFECEILNIENNILSILRNFFYSFYLLKKYNPDLVIGLGSYISIPVLSASFFLRIPILIHEQNVIPGKANKFLSRWAEKILISFKETERFFRREKTYLISNPLRKMKYRSKEEIYQELGLELNRKTILIFGGSLGAKKLNISTLEALPLLKEKENMQILHITGKDKLKEVEEEKRRIKDLKIKYKIIGYYEDLLEILRFADLVVSRAGATTCSEIAFLGKPVIFVPYPYATNAHQEYNAKIFEKNGGAIVFKDAEFSGEKLAETIFELFKDEEKLKEMGERNKKNYLPFDTAEFMNLIYSFKKY